VLLALVVVIAVGAGGIVELRRMFPGPPVLPSGEVDAFLGAWGEGDARTMASLLDRPPADLATLASSLVDAAPGSHGVYSRTSLVRNASGGGATARYHAHVDLAGFGSFDWNGVLPIARMLVAKQMVWRIVWRSSDLYPGLAAGQQLTLRAVWPTRDPIVGSDGSLLSGPLGIVTIGLEPERITKTLPRIEQLLHTLVGTNPATIYAALVGPGVRPNYFVAVATVPDDVRFATVLRPKLAPVDGVFFQHSQGTLAASAPLDRQRIGTVGPITPARLHQLGPPYRLGDTVGLSGLEAADETRLAGSPNGFVVIEAGTKLLRIVKTFPGRAPQSVTITINPSINTPGSPRSPP
jgi:hypothetical protein